MLVAGSANAGSGAASAANQTRIDADRWMEIDLYWFEQKDIAGSVNQFWDRFLPLYAGVEGDRGVILNIGWTVQFIMDWSGNPAQRIKLPTGSGQEPWVDESTPLTGTTQERMRKWKERFSHPVMVQRHGYDPWTYADLKTLVAALRETGRKRGIANFKVGALTYAWTRAYGELAPWAKRHPEAFTPSKFNQPGAFGPCPCFDPGASLHADNAPLGGLPGGIREGTPVHEAFAAQWGSLSRAVGLDAIMLRDSFGMMLPYQRGGPFGVVAPSPEAARKLTADVAAMVRELKSANPKALVMMYSNAASAVADWRSNCMDLESIAREGSLDIWVDQTWAGAWNEVGVREKSFWNHMVLGWTYQLTNMLVHAAVLADTKVRHYPLVETFDAWESWDVIHSAPERLRWGIWAYSHAAVKTPRGLKLPAGTYISWANQGKRLLGDADVKFLADNINAAVTDARETTEVFGPTLVYSRQAVEWQMNHAAPNRDFKEWIDEQAGSVIKWPLPVLSVTRAEWLPQVKSDLFIVQTPAQWSGAQSQYLAGLIKSGQPVALFGSPQGPLFELAGLSGVRGDELRPHQRSAELQDKSQKLAEHIPQQFSTYAWMGKNRALSGARVIYSVEGSPALTIDLAGGKKVLAWDPPEFKFNGDIPLREAWGGSAAGYALTAGALNSLLAGRNTLHAAAIDLNQTMNVTSWRTRDGQIKLLAGNLEEGLRDDADLSRHATLLLPDNWPGKTFRDLWTGRTIPVSGRALTIRLQQAQSVLLTPEKNP